jgi:hypothetical protein
MFYCGSDSGSGSYFGKDLVPVPVPVPDPDLSSKLAQFSETKKLYFLMPEASLFPESWPIITNALTFHSTEFQVLSSFLSFPRVKLERYYQFHTSSCCPHA